MFSIHNSVFAKNNNFQDGIDLFNIKKFQEAKFKFEQEIVLNPKSELSYMYLSKIFKNLDKKDLEEQNLNTVILLNPKNEEAIFNLAKLKLNSSDYKKSKELNNRLSSVCKKLCEKSKKLSIEIENLSKK
jgi:tetratricopeptide (TPR) repeat protein